MRVRTVLPEAGDFGAALGAARLGACASTGADPKTIMTTPPVAKRFAPRDELRQAYDESYGRYRALYPMVSAL